ncbi:hypothetical protein MFIFM68171_11181 [Madurella fahalii]|uniref:Uncharacterized protein n=1 Tax=Madurella fahalii TaxID=1157608 RepID=A0ABQ0GTB3_9PEZI
MHVFCAICGSSHDSVEIGSSESTALQRQRRIVAHKRERLEYEDTSYDPKLVRDKGLLWLGNARCSGINLQALGDLKASSTLTRAATWRPGILTRISYGASYLPGRIFEDFPFHEPCINILSQVLTGTSDEANIDKETLYDAMYDLIDSYGTCLDIDHGNVTGRSGDLGWISVPGNELLSEFSVTDPSTTPQLTELFEAYLAGCVFGRQDNLGVTQMPRIKDPFSWLLYELLIFARDAGKPAEVNRISRYVAPSTCGQGAALHSPRVGVPETSRVISLDIDGKIGEHIDEIAICQGLDEIVAFMTNRDRKLVIEHAHRGEWTSQHPP